MSTTSSLHHFVFSTYKRRMTISQNHETDLYRYIWHLLSVRNCKLIRIGGIENHIHIFVDIHPAVAVAELAGELKRKSSLWMKRSGMFPGFEGWGKEYFAFSKSVNDKNATIDYIKRQREHHGRVSFEEEIKSISILSGFDWKDELLTCQVPLPGHHNPQD